MNAIITNIYCSVLSDFAFSYFSPYVSCATNHKKESDQWHVSPAKVLTDSQATSPEFLITRNPTRYKLDINITVMKFRAE